MVFMFWKMGKKYKVTAVAHEKCTHAGFNRKAILSQLNVRDVADVTLHGVLSSIQVLGLPSKWKKVVH